MNYSAARDEIFGVFWAAWKPTGYSAVYDDVTGEIPTTEAAWARATIRHGTGGQSSLAGMNGKRMFRRNGTAWFQIFAPIGDGSVAGYAAAQLVTKAFEAARGCVWFRNVRLNEKGKSGAFQQYDVLVDFTYDDIS